MNIRDLIRNLQELKIRLMLNGDELELEFPTGEPVPYALISELRTRRNEILDYVKSSLSDACGAQEIPPLEKREFYEVSNGQNRLWILNQFKKEQTAFTIHSSFFIKGKFNAEAFHSAIEYLMSRHEILRTTFHYSDNKLYQKVHKKIGLKFKDYFLDLSTNEKDFQEQLTHEKVKIVQKPFDFGEAPLFRYRIIRKSDIEHHLLFSMAHIISDAWSMSIINSELISYYLEFAENKLPSVPALRVQYKEYASWQRQVLSGLKLETLKNYWLTQFRDGVPIMNLPTSFDRPAVKSFNGDSVLLSFSEEISNKFRYEAEKHGSTLFTILMATVNAFVHKYCSADEVVLGTTVSCRNHRDLESQIGFYVNTLALVTPVNNRENFKDVIEKTKQILINAMAHETYPFDWLVQDLNLDRDVSRSPVFDILVEMNNAGDVAVSEPVKAKDLVFIPEEVDSPYTQYDLSFKFTEARCIELRLEYSTDLFSKEFSNKIAGHYKNFVEALLTDISLALGKVEFISEEEREIILKWGAGREVVMPKTNFFDIWKSTVKSFKDNIAVCDDQSSLTYGEFDDWSERLACYLIKKNKGKNGTIVGVLMEPSHWTPVVLIGILKAGMSFLPLAGDLPLERKKFILEDAGVGQLITDSAHMFEIMEYYSGAIFSTDIQMKTLETPTGQLVKPSTSDLPAYVIYTSGSTGVPKGVVVGMASLMNYINWAKSFYFNNQSGNDMPLFTSLSFDLTLTSIFCPLTSGDCVHVFPSEELHRTFRSIFDSENKIKAIKMTPGQLEVLQDVEIVDRTLEVVILGGEIVFKKHLYIINSIFPNALVYNEYGPTEATIGCIAKEVRASDRKISIGNPIQNVKVKIVNGSGSMVSQGIAGELLISGYCLSQGYLNREDLNDKYFIENFDSAEINYKTGDICRWLTDGSIEFLGRVDDQVKLRGYRISLGEIEYQLMQFPEVVDAVVILGANSKTDVLIAYLVIAGETPVENIQAYLREKLPDYMIPSVFKIVDKIPLNSNGKKNLKLLPKILEESKGNIEYQEAVTNTEKIMARLWEEILEKERVGANDNFFSLGGDSIKAIRLVSRFQNESGIEIGVQDIFNFQDVKSLANFCDKEAIHDQTAVERIHWASKIELFRNDVLSSSVYFEKLPEDWEDFYPMSEIEKGMIFHNYMNGVSGVYHDQFYHQFIDKEFSMDKLVMAFQLLTEKHEILRSSYNLVDFEAPLHIVHCYADQITKVSDFDLSTLNKKEQEEALQNHMLKDRVNSFDVEIPGLWRIAIFKLSEVEYGLLWVFHHAIIDGWSNASLVTELSNIYFGLKSNNDYRPEMLSATYKDYIVDQWRIKNNPTIRTWWKNYMAGYQRTELPFNRSASGLQGDFQVKTLSFPVDIDLNVELQKVASQLCVGVKEVFLASFLYLLKFSGWSQDDIVIGLVTNGRPEIGEGDKILGCFLNTVPFRTKVEVDIDPIKFIKRIASEVYEQKAYDKLPLQEIVKITGEPTSSQNPFFDIMFNYVDFHIHSDLHKETVGSDNLVENFENTNTYFDININHTGTNATLAFNYAKSLFNDEEIFQLARYYERILRCIVEGDQFSPMDILGDREVKTLLHDFNDTKADFPDNKSIDDLFRMQVAKQPDHIAIEHDGNSITFRELDRQTDEWAHKIIEKSNSTGLPIGVKMDACIERIIAILAIVKSGSPYVPIDNEFPIDRVSRIIENTGLTILFTDDLEISKKFDTSTIKTIDPRNILKSKISSKRNSLPISRGVERPAYVMYTSGSTGQPKGVVISHKGVVNRIDWMWKAFDFSDKDVIIQKTPLTFDVSVWEVFMPLCYGTKMVLNHKNAILDIALYNSYVSTYKVTTTHFVPSLLSVFLDAQATAGVHSLKTLQRIFCSGEALENFLVAKNGEITGIPIINLYGPTEASVDVSYYHTTKGDQKIPIGKPIANIQLYVLDKDMYPAPVNVKGEIYIAGVGLAYGYLNQIALTEERFVDHPFLKGSKLYKTGDLGRWLPDGNLMYEGRTDHQIKIKGVRIEPIEIEEAILEYPQVLSAVVMVVKEQLIGFFKSQERLDTNLIQTFLRQHLPAYMIPQNFVQVKTMPITANGKVDRKALAQKKEKIKDVVKNSAPVESKLEHDVLEIWKKTLGQDSLSIADNFFEKGGDSIKVIQIISRMNQAGYYLEMRQIFDNPSIEQLAPFIKSNKRDIDQAPVLGQIEMSPIQLNFFKHPRKFPEHFNQAVLLRARKRLNIKIIGEVLQILRSHHDVLRAIFYEKDGEIIQEIRQEGSETQLKVYSFQEEKDAVAKMEEEASQIQKTFRLQEGPLLKSAVFQLIDDDYLLLVAHHLVVDGVSWRIVMEDFQLIYEALEKGNEVSLPLKTDSFGSYTKMLRSYSNNKAFEKEKQYWRELISKANGVEPICHIETSNMVVDTDSISFKLDLSQTESLIQKTNFVFGTSVQEVLLTALGLASKKIFGHSQTTIMLEGHGREPLHLEIDISRTVGWFTSVFPVVIDITHEDDLTRQVKEIKENLRNVPSKGIGFGILSFLLEESNTSLQVRPQIVYNYLGQFDEDLKQLSFKIAEAGPGPTINMDEEREYPLDFSSWVIDGQLEVSVSFGVHQFDKSTIASLMHIYEHQLSDIIALANSKDKPEISPSDFSNAAFTIDELENIFD